MNVVDIVVLTAIVLFAWSGWRNGFVSGLLSFIGLERSASPSRRRW